MPRDVTAQLPPPGRPFSTSSTSDSWTTWSRCTQPLGLAEVGLAPSRHPVPGVFSRRGDSRGGPRLGRGRAQGDGGGLGQAVRSVQRPGRAGAAAAQRSRSAGRCPWRGAHTLVHGDWKAANLGSHADGRTVLLDFGEVPGEASPIADLSWYLALDTDRCPRPKTKRSPPTGTPCNATGSTPPTGGMGSGGQPAAVTNAATRTPKTHELPGQRPRADSVELRGLEPLTLTLPV